MTELQDTEATDTADTGADTAEEAAAAKAKPAPAGPVTPVSPIQIEPVDVGHLFIPIIGTSPLIVHRFSEKAKATMLGAQQGRAKQKEVRDPEADYEASMYRFADGGTGFPVVAFKAATVGAARFYGKKVSMTELRMMMFFRGTLGVDNIELARIEGEPKQREDYVRLSMSSTDLRFRAEYVDWRTNLHVQFVRSALSQESVLSLVEAGGLGGVGEYRPNKSATGAYGTYELDRGRSVEVR